MGTESQNCIAIGVIMQTKYLTQRIEIEDEIDEMLTSMSYPNTDDIRNGILDMINMISDYHEEGTPLYPNVIITDSESYFKTFNSNRTRIAKNELKRHEFSQSIKMCAPLAVDGWSIYIIISVKNNFIEYGVLTTEIQILSLDLYEQTMESAIPEINSLFIRNVGNKVVEVRNVQQQMLVALNLSDEYLPMDDSIRKLTDSILTDDDNLREARNYLSKTILQALNEGHGSLIAVVHDDGKVINEVLGNLHGGILLDDSIDIKGLISDYRKYQTEESSAKLRSYAGLMQSMLNFDGITLFSDNGKVLGYHFIVNNNAVTDEHVQGGSRTRAFLALCSLACIKACFIKSQDGKVKFDRK